MRRCRWKFVLGQNLSDAHQAMLLTLPGVRCQGPRVVLATFDVGDMVMPVLESWGYAIIDGERPQPQPVPDLSLVPNLHYDKIKPFQREGLTWMLARGGGYFFWPCGTGKTVVGIGYTLARRKRTLIVTKGSTTHQWAGQFAQFTDLDLTRDLAVIEGRSGFDAKRVEEPPAPTLMVRRTSSLADEVIADDYPKRWTPALAEALALLPITGAEVLWSEIPANRRGQVKALMECGYAVTREHALAAWKPWQVYSKESGLPVSYHGFGDTFLAPQVEIDTWTETVLSSDFSMEAKQRAYVLLQVNNGKPADVLLGEVASAIGEEAARTYIDDVVGEYVATQQAEALSATLEISPDVWILIVGWPVLTERLTALLAWGPEVYIVDEAHNAKSHSLWTPIPMPDGKPRFVRKETAAASSDAIASHRTIEEVVELSATPIPDRVRDLWCQWHHFDPYLIGNFQTWAARYCAAFEGEYGQVTTGASNEEELTRRKNMIMHQLSQERANAELPPLLVTVVEIPVNLQGAGTRMKRGPRGGSMALLQDRLSEAASKTTPYVVRRVLECAQDNENVVVITSQVEHAETLAHQLRTRLGNDRVYLGTGADTESTERQSMVAGLLTHRDGAVLIGTLEAWKEGIDGFQKVDRAFVAMLPWNLSIQQLLGRFRRIGGRNTGVAVEILVPLETMAERVIEVLVPKLRAVGAVLGGGDEELAEQLDRAVTGNDSEILEALAARLLAHEEDKITADDDEEEATP